MLYVEVLSFGECMIYVNVYYLSLYLQDILENEDLKLDNMFIASLVKDIIQVMVESYDRNPDIYFSILKE